MFKKILPKTAIGRLYVGAFVISSAIGTTAAVVTIACERVFNLKSQ